MKAIILAAGVGSRLRPITDLKPKTLVTVNNKPMIGYIVESLIKANVSEVIVCIGYRSEQLKQFLIDQYSSIVDFTFINNSAYETTNNMYSLYLAREFLQNDVIIMNADLVFDANIIKNLVDLKGSYVATDKGRFMEESMKVVVDGGVISEISKKILEKDSYGCSIDIYKFDNNAVKILYQEIVKIIEIDEDLNQWTEVLLDKVFSEGLIIAAPMDIEGSRWFEIDNFDDLSKAEILFNEKIADLANKKAFILDKDGTIAIGKTPIDGAGEFMS